MNINTTLQRIFNTEAEATDWANKKVASGKWHKASVKPIKSQIAGGAFIQKFQAVVRNPNPVLSPYTGRPIGPTQFAKGR